MIEDTEDRRAADQDAAIEAAFAAGALPEEDRRRLHAEAAAERARDAAALVAAEDAARAVAQADGEGQSAVPSLPPLEDRVPVGSIIERHPHGWTVRLMYGGAIRLHGEGATIHEALAAVGL